jgi:hypothetical protein
MAPKRRRRPRGAQGTPERAPSPGDCVVFDANIIVDWLLAKVGDHQSDGAQAMSRALNVCWRGVLSGDLQSQVVGAVHDRGLPVPHGPILDLIENSKLTFFSRTRVRAAKVPPALAKLTPKRDELITQLAVAARAVWIVTRDGEFLTKGQHWPRNLGTRVVDPTWVLEATEGMPVCS